MGSIRFPSQSDALSQATLNGDTLLPCRYKAGTVDDSDKAIPFNILQSSPVAVCNSSADMTNKIATVDNYPDFQLVNGREVVCYFVNGNTATNPSININGTGAISLEGSYWNAGTFLKLKYVDITVSGTRIQKWLIDLGSYNTKAQLNGALTNQIIHRRYNGVTGSDGAHAWTIGIAITGYKPVLYDIVGGNSTQVLIQAETFVDNALQGFCNIGNYNFSVDVLYIKNS